MARNVPQEHVRVPMLRQRWERMSFLHWALAPERLAALLPDGVVPHVRDNRAWVSLTPFAVTRFRGPVGPSVPVVSRFPETNVRTYVVGPDGSDGLFFLGIDADALLTTLAARVALGAPYHWSRMEVEADGAAWRYRCRRRTDPSIGHDVVVVPGERAVDTGPDSPAGWLAGRWRAWTSGPGGWSAVPVEHRPWELVEAEVRTCEAGVLDAAGLGGLGPPDLVHAAVGVYDVALGWPRFSRRAQAAA